MKKVLRFFKIIVSSFNRIIHQSTLLHFVTLPNAFAFYGMQVVGFCQVGDHGPSFVSHAAGRRGFVVERWLSWEQLD